MVRDALDSIARITRKVVNTVGVLLLLGSLRKTEVTREPLVMGLVCAVLWSVWHSWQRRIKQRSFSLSLTSG